MKKILISLGIFLIMSSAFARNRIKDEFTVVYKSLVEMSEDNMMREEQFIYDYGLIFEIAKEIEAIYEEGTTSEGSTAFKDRMFYMSYIWLSHEKIIGEDKDQIGLNILIDRTYNSILRIIMACDWSLIIETADGEVEVSGGELLNVAKFDGNKKRIKYKGTSLSKIFTSPLKAIVETVTTHMQFEDEELKAYETMIENADKIQNHHNPSDLSRTIRKASKAIIDAYDDIEEDLRKVRQGLRKKGDVLGLNKINNIRRIVVSLKEHRNYGNGYTR